MSTEEKNIKGKLVLDLVREFCSKKLNEEYFELAERMTKKLMQKRTKPLESGQTQIWAASIIHALGTVNFLFDKTFEPYISIEELNQYFETNKSTTAAKSKQIRDMLKISVWGTDFLTHQMIDSNPLNNMVMVDDMIFPVNALPEELQNAVRKARAEGKEISYRTK